MHLRLLQVLIPLIFIHCSISAQPVVRGKVIDGSTGTSLPGVHIIYGTTEGVLSDPNGEFQFSPEPGSYTIVFRFIGYQQHQEDIQLRDSDTVSLNVSLNQNITSINEIVVSAGRREQRISDISVSMNILKPYQIARYHIINAEELLHKTTGLEVMDGQISIRGGSGYSYGAGSRVITLIDGLPSLSADAGNVKWGTLPIENISRIEVIKGASSVLYGSSALNGVINFITRDASIEPITRVSVSAGIYDKPSRKEWAWWDSPRMTQNLSFSHSQKYGNTELGVGVRAMNDNGYRKFNDDRNIRVSLNLKQGSSKYKSLQYGFSAYGSYNAKNDFLLWDNADDGALIQSESTEMDYRGLSAAFDPFVSVKGSRSGEHALKGRVLSNLNRLPDNTNNNSDSHSVYLEYQYSQKISNSILLVAGLLENYSLITSNFYGDHKGLNLAAYTQLDASITERIKAVSGVRLEHYTLDGIADKPVPIFRAGINVKAGPKTFLRSSFGQGYRYPSIAEKHAYTTVGAIKIFPNVDIKAEKGWSAELGLKQSLDAKLLTGEIDIAIYYSQNTDMIEYVFGNHEDPVTLIYYPGFRPINIENSRVYGFETQVFLNRSIGAFNNNLSAGYTYMFPVEYNAVTNKNTGDYLKYRRKHTANIALGTRYRRIEIGLTLYYKSEILEIDDVFLNPLTREDILPGFFDYWNDTNSGYFLVDLNAGYRFSDNFQLSLTIKNLTNTEYMGRPGDIQPHRYFSIMLANSF